MRRWAIVLETAAIYVGAIVGAGFASGREIYVFFVRYGAAGPAAAAAAGILIGVAAAALLPGAIRAGVDDYATMCRFVAGRLGRASEVLLSLFLFAGLSVMLAAGATVIALHTPITYSASVIVMALVTLGFVTFGARGIAAANNWLVPYLAIAVMAVATAILAHSPGAGPGASLAAASRPHGSLAWSLLLYVGYNFVTGVAVLLSLPPANARQRATGAFFGGAILALMLGTAAPAIAAQVGAIASVPMPLLTLAKGLGRLWAVAYIPAIGAAILTTAVGDAFALARRFSPSRPWLAGSAAVILAVPLANQGFVTLVDNGYPLLGLAGLLFLASAIWRILRPKARRR